MISAVVVAGGAGTRMKTDVRKAVSNAQGDVRFSPGRFRPSMPVF